MLQPLEEAIATTFIPALIGRKSISALERKISALPTRLGGLGIPFPAVEAAFQYKCSLEVTAPLVKKIIEQDQVLSYEDLCDQIAAEREVRKARRQHQEEAAKELRDAGSAQSILHVRLS